MRKRNKYGLSAENEAATDGVVIDITVKYNIEDDKVEIDVGRRIDVSDQELLLRLSQQVENAMRQVFPKYDEEIKFLEILAGLNKDDDGDDVCRCNCRD